MSLSIQWDKKDDYHAVWEHYWLTRCVVGSVDIFNVYVGKNHVPVNFKSSREAVEWVKWAEGQARSRLVSDMTDDQRDVI